MAAMVARSADTDPEAENVQVEVMGLARRAIQRSLPEANQEEVQRRFVALQYRQELSSGLRLYLAARAR